jgi:hypothetical protein
MRALVVSLCLLALGPSAWPDSADRLFIRPWVELEPLVRFEAGVYPIPVATAQKDLLEEGRELFSGMIYGWTFTYIPGDLSRRVQESFTLTAVAEIQWGSPQLSVQETEIAEERLWARISYRLSPEESQRRTAWGSNTAAMSTGRGTASVMGGPAAKRDSLRQAIRDAIRLSLDTRYVNKPREITGEVVLWDDPLTFVASGTYTTSAKVKVLVRELIPYRIF